MAVAILSCAGPVLHGCTRHESSAAREPHELTIYAIPPVTEAFTALAREFERTHPPSRITLRFASLPQLESEIADDCAADILVSTSMKVSSRHMQQGIVRAPVVFAWNKAVVVVNEENQSIRTFEDLPLAPRIAVAAPHVPLGDYTARILEASDQRFGRGFRDRVEAHIVNWELHDHAVLDEVAEGRADAGIVFETTRYAGAEGVRFIEVPPEINVVAKFTAAVVSCSPDSALAGTWLGFLASYDAKHTLEQFGFMVERPPGDGSL